MATTLDHRHFRDTHENLTALHDAWMHSSTGTSNTAQGVYEHGSSPPTVYNPNDIPESHTALLGFSPSDISTFIGTKGGPPPIKSGGNVSPMGQTSGGGGNGGSGGCPQGMCDKGGGHCGSGCFCCSTQEEVDLCMQGMCGTNCSNCQQSGGGGSPDSKGGGGGKGGGKGHVHKGHSKGGHGKGGGGGTKAQGANAIGRVPQLGNVPYSPTPAGGSSPIMVILLLGGGALLIYFIWHKLRKSKAEDKEMSQKGE